MGFFKRLKNVIEAKANKALYKHENPIEMLELSINKKENRRFYPSRIETAVFLISFSAL